MNYESLVPVIGSLVGALIGAGAVLVGQRRQWKQDRESSSESQYALAVEELVVRASSLDMASHQAVSLAGAFSSVGGQLNRLIRIVTPFDQQALFEGMNVHFEGLNRAAARLRMTQDQEAVSLTNAVMLAAAEVIEAHHASPSRNRLLLRMLHELFAGKQLGDPAAISRTRAALAESVRALVQHMRRQLNHSHVDLWAVPEPSQKG